MSEGGEFRVWSHDRRELFYLGLPNFRIMVAGYSVAGDSFSATRPRLWHDTRVDSFDVMPDGKRAVMIPAADQKESTHATLLHRDDLRRHLRLAK